MKIRHSIKYLLKSVYGKNKPKSGDLLSEPYFIPEISLVVMTVATILYTLGCYFYGAKKFSKKWHFKFSLSGWISSLTFFILYLTSIAVRTVAPTAPDYIRPLYLPVLIAHMITATITLGIPVYLLILGLGRRSGKKTKSMRKIGIINVILWYITYVSGIIIYICLHIL